MQPCVESVEWDDFSNLKAILREIQAVKLYAKRLNQTSQTLCFLKLDGQNDKKGKEKALTLWINPAEWMYCSTGS